MELTEQLEEADRARKKLKEGMQSTNDKIIQLEEELYESKTMANELLDKLKHAEDELEPLQEQIRKLLIEIDKLKHDTYIPRKRDVLDEQLGDYLTMYPEKEKLKIMFLRETEGVYKFGSKRVYLKIEKGEQIFVRVGGGYMGIDEFIEKYTESEVDKIQRRDVIDRFSKKKAI